MTYRAQSEGRKARNDRVADRQWRRAVEAIGVYISPNETDREAASVGMRSIFSRVGPEQMGRWMLERREAVRSVMHATKGSANPALVREVIQRERAR